MITAELTIIPIGTGDTSLSDYIAAAIKAIEKKNIKYEISGMGTQIEAKDLEDILDAIKAAHEAVFKLDCDRVYTTVKIDDRRDVEKTLKDKITSVKSKL
ncbi:MTH1187 family thiamine-binding protein [Methanothermobacter tenebrarum]|uniref:Thiamine-binding protein n=1 Tax=Methanothermobacter tenebrarum TaxID=680118 RepID=A0A328PI78_9EURY|nr:MTH1187 family thiamine-binding protein [Methanothermobacter tenebrarum]MBC7101386.1 MTH1187 family thiamine-binding protein [Methanobacteriales archaeon]MBC7118016.1 MTH1187 family thiamine-binding protein [Methanobacteriaceae archaeon]NPV65197.1 MTH1187 family thiamine-binding protein [Methanobacteriaceae archaeon]RAO79565.1 thiamine-binding protein [Methanothermobacter tenebrarum]